VSYLERLPWMLLYQALLPMLGYLAIGIPFILLERKFPAHRVDYRRRLAADLGNCAIVFVNGIGISIVVFDGVINRLELWRRFDFTLAIPLWLSLPLVAVGIDFTLYWLHRALHSKLLWPIHRWHHAPTEIYWLSGIRASFVQNTLYVLVSLTWAIALHVPQQLFGLGGLGAALNNDFMHANWRLRLPWLERVVVTPRVHLLHHRKTQTETFNYGAFFSLWDHWFGTWSNPDTAEPVKEFGIDETVNPVRIVVGV